MIPITDLIRSHPAIDRRLSSNPRISTLVGTIVIGVTSITGPSISPAIARETAQASTASPAPTETIVLGRSSSDHYVVIIPVPNLDRQTINLTSPTFQLLQKIRTIVPSAFLARHSLGDYIYVNGFTKSGPAHQQVEQLRPYAVNARVVYFR